MKKKQRCFVKRFVALVAALMLCASLCVPCFASNNWPSSPSFADFVSHHGSWYVWQQVNYYGERGFELICSPMVENGDTNTANSRFSTLYSTNSGSYTYTNSSGVTVTLLTAIPYIPLGASGYWAELPSFPVGSGLSYSHCAFVRLYPNVKSGFLSNIDDVFNDSSLRAYLTSAFSESGSSFSDTYEHEVLDDSPVYVPNTIYPVISKTDTSSNHTSFSISDGSSKFWATPSNGVYLNLSDSHQASARLRSYAQNAFIPSSELGFVFIKDPGSGFHPYNTEFNVSDLAFTASLWVPAAFLPSNTKVGDWISNASIEGLQDELVNDFDVNSDTLKNSKDNLNSWNSTSSVDSDVASGATGLLNGIFQNLGTFLFSVSLLCFGAVVLRMLIRKAVDG